ncbi:MAG: hypothetical protein COB02_09500 [Candidatus Cloacimonadota bacterium]|nr:MAG: hypothetical protein COB02_09500 [Candidatus Cloacimonadota bacterium]
MNEESKPSNPVIRGWINYYGQFGKNYIEIYISFKKSVNLST